MLGVIIVYNLVTVKHDWIWMCVMLGQRLNSVRHMQNISARKMAELLNVDIRTYRYYESNDRQPPLDTLVMIADILDISIDYLLGRDDFIARHEKEKV